MATKAVVVTGQLPTTNAAYVDFTSTGFGTPDAAIIISSNANATNPQAGGSYSVGFWVSGGQACASIDQSDASTDSITGRKTQNGDALYFQNQPVTPGTFNTLTQITASSTTDGIRLTKDTGSSGAARHTTVILLAGLTNEAVGSVNLGTGTNAISVNTGFRADAVLAFTIGAGDDTAYTNSILSFGAAHIDGAGTVDQGLISFSSETAVATTDVDTMVRDDAIACQNFNGTLTWRASIGADNSGFTITPSANTSSDIVYYLALELADPDDAFVGIVDTITGTGAQAYNVTTFTPDVLLLGQTMCTATNTNTTQGAFSIGAGGPDTVEQCLAIIDEDNQADSDNEAYKYDGIVCIRDAVGSDETLATLTSLDSDGWTLNYSNGSSTARKMLAFAIGDSTASGGATDLTPSFYTNTQTFYNPTVSAGAVTLAPSLYTNTNSFFSPTISTTVSLTPSLYTNNNTFYTHLIEVEGGAQNILPSLYTNTNTFYDATVGVGSVTLTPTLHTNTNSFFAASVTTSNTLVAPFVVNTSSFFTHEVTQGAAGAQDLQPDLLLNNNSFFVATVTGGAQLRQKDGTSKKKKVDKTKEQLELERIFGKEESTEELILKFIDPVVKIPTDVLRKEVAEVATKPTSAVLLDYLVEMKQTVAKEEQVKITQAIQQYTEAQIKIKKKKVAKKREEELLLMWMI